MIGRRGNRSAVRPKRRAAPRPALVVLAGVLTTLVVGGFIWLAEHAYNGLPFLSYRNVYVSLPNIGHLKQHDPVNIAGVRVGQVLKTSTKNNRALVELQLQGVGPLPIDSTAVVRANGLLGARYMDLIPGKSRQMLPNNGTITETGAQATYTWGVPEALNLFDPKTRAALGQMLNGLGEGFTGRGSQLNQTVHVGPSSGHNFDLAAYAILARPNAAQNFFSYLNSGATALNTAKDDFANMLGPSAQALGPFTTERTAVDAAEAYLPTVEQSVSAGFAPVHFERLANHLVTFAHAVAPVLPELPGALRSATALLRAGQGPLQKAKTVVDEVPRAVPAALGILSSIKPDLTPLHGLFTDLVPTVTQLALHGCDIQNFATGARSMTSWGTYPGPPWGVNSGFPFGPTIGPGNATNEINLGLEFPRTYKDIYAPPCAFSPGPVFNNATFLGLLQGLFK
jgi:virulence factor Mce-like protein